MNFCCTFVLVLTVLAVTLPLIIFSGIRGQVLTFKRRPTNDTSYLSQFYQVNYRNITEIYSYIKHLTESYSFFCELSAIGYTSRKASAPGLPIYNLKISSGYKKPIILIMGGIFANDWLSTTSILYVANQFLANCSSGDEITTYDFYFIPIVNPEGYRYSLEQPLASTWVKNVARWSMDSMGVNLDYNFGHFWRAMYNFKEDTFPGVKAFSEEESRILSEYVRRIKSKLELVIILKSATAEMPQEPAITYPWSYTRRKPPQWATMQYMAMMGAEAAYNSTRRNFTAAQSGLLATNQSGRIDDWLLSEGVKVITVQDNFVANFLIDPYLQINRKGSQTMQIIRALCSVLYQKSPYKTIVRKMFGRWRGETNPKTKPPAELEISGGTISTRTTKPQTTKREKILAKSTPSTRKEKLESSAASLKHENFKTLRE